MRKHHFTTLATGLVLLSSTALFAQRKETDPKHEYHYAVKTIDNDDVKVEFLDAQSQKEFTLAKLQIMNKTSDYIFFKGSESAFKYEFGELKPTGGGAFQGMNKVIAPNETNNKTLKVAGQGQNYHVKELTFIPNGFYKVSAEGTVQIAPDFKLPLATNDFTAGKFKCKVDKLDKQTDETKVTFKCVYTGKDVGIVDPSRMVVKIKSGQEFVNDKKSEVELLSQNDDIKIVATFHVPGKIEDMQFANMDIVWKNTFSESKLQPINMEPVKFEFDAGKTDGKNR
jgi:hypothetical protein